MTEKTAIQTPELKAAELKAAGLKAAELKFLMKLWNCHGYRSDIAHLSPTPKTPMAKRDRICRAIAEKGLIEFDSEIYRFTLSPAGRVLLTLQTTSLPVTPDELNLLRSCRGSMTPAKLRNCVPESSRTSLIHELVARKLLKVVKTAIAEVRLTVAGQQLLQRLTAENNQGAESNPVI